MVILGESPAKGFDDITVTQKLKILMILHNQEKGLCLSLHNNESSSYSLVNAIKLYQFKAKD